MPKPVAVLLAAVLAALGLAACGGGSSSTGETGASGTSASPTSTGRSASAKGGAGQPAKKGKAGESKHSKGASAGVGAGSSGGSAVPPLKVSGGGSDQYRTKGGDNSIQEFGEETGESELQQAAEALHGFYVARAAGEWERACSYLAKQVAKQLEQLASRSPQLKGKGCGAVLNALTRPLPPAAERETTQIDAGSLRQEGERAFLIYSGAEGKAYATPMQLEGGAWKVGSLAGTPLG